MKIVNLKHAKPHNLYEVECKCGKLFDVDIYMQLFSCPSCGKMCTKKTLERNSTVSFTTTRREE